MPGWIARRAATHLQFGWVVPFSEKFDVMVYGGPSFFRLEQDVVSDVQPRRDGRDRYDRHRDHRPSPTRKKSETGFNVGADATYIVWQNDSVRLGAGGFVRFTQARHGRRHADARSQPTEVGGVQFGFGARLRF